MALDLKTIILLIFATPTILWLLVYVATNIYLLKSGPVDLKKKYNAKWALVTGAGTGIGKSLAETMALQGLNVVLVSLPDKYLQETTATLRAQFPQLEFRRLTIRYMHMTFFLVFQPNLITRLIICLISLRLPRILTFLLYLIMLDIL